jgi:hypothetical protein
MILLRTSVCHHAAVSLRCALQSPSQSSGGSLIGTFAANMCACIVNFALTVSRCPLLSDPGAHVCNRRHCGGRQFVHCVDMGYRGALSGRLTVSIGTGLLFVLRQPRIEPPWPRLDPLSLPIPVQTPQLELVLYIFWLRHCIVCVTGEQ